MDKTQNRKKKALLQSIVKNLRQRKLRELKRTVREYMLTLKP